MKKSYLILAAIASVALASCSSEEYLGEVTPNNSGGAIQFASNTPRLTRAEGSDAAKALDYKFKVYGVKKVGSDYSNVFATGAYGTATDYNADPDAYWVWYTTTTAGTTASNTADWEYVGAAGTHGTTSHEATVLTNKDQFIKYWDYSAASYEFVAYSATAGMPTITKYKKDGFTVSATAAQLAGLYIADKKTVSPENYKKTVQFTFRASGAKVRLGIYETIPGYEVRNVKFRPNASEFEATTANAKLSGHFNGNSSSSSATFNVTYGPHAIFTQEGTTAQSSFFDFGTFDTDADPTTAILGTSSTSPTWASGSSAYQSVLPNTDYVSNMILYVDYELYNDKSHETIKVKGAKAVVPAMYMTWNPNYAYTYLFKISDNTNGTTGTEGTSPEGLFPITFDAVTIATTDGAEVGIITTVTTPAITTYQEGSVSDAGITYANANGAIYITVNTDGTLASLTSTNMKLYKLAAADADATEADLVLVPSKLTGKEVTGEVPDILSVPSTGENESKQGITFTVGNYAKFTPAAGQTYAVEYNQPARQATGTYVSGKKYYTTATCDVEVDTSSFTGTTDVSSYFLAPASKHYKIIKVASGS